MLKQEVFDIAAAGLLVQKARSTCEESDLCKYRGEGGRKCAVGFLIKDSEYSPEMEEKSVSDLFRATPPSSLAEIKKFPELLMRLQNIHDKYEVKFWPKQLKELARSLNLDSSIVDNISKFSGNVEELLLNLRKESGNTAEQLKLLESL